MVQIAMLVFAFPLGAARWSRRAAYGATLTIFVVALIPQTIDQHNVENPLPAAYWIVQVVTLAVAYGLVSWGSNWGQHRRAERLEVSARTSTARR